MNDIERQLKREADAFRDGVRRYNQSRQYQLATGTKPVADLVSSCLKALADGILDVQLALKTAQSPKPPKYAIALNSIDHERIALITLSMLFNTITSSEFKKGQAPPTTGLAYDIGQRLRLERIHDGIRGRKVDIAQQMLSRNRSAHAGRRAAEWARKLDDPHDWAKNFRSYHLGHKLIVLAVGFARFNGQPVFELKTVLEGSGKNITTTQTIGLTTSAADWIANHPSTLEFMPGPVHQPMVIPPRPWVSLDQGGYLATPLNFVKHQPRSARELLESVGLSPVFSAVNALQSTAFRVNNRIYRFMRHAWNTNNLLFGLKTHTFQPLPPELPDDADPKEIRKRKRERRDAFSLNSKIKALKAVMAFRLATAEGVLDEAHIYFPHQVDYRSRAYPVPQLMNPQSDDIGRSLLMYEEGKPLGERGAYWLAIHLFNCYWKGKQVSFAERILWVRQHTDEILDFAADPIRPHRFWNEADKPWMFLAACLEWAGYIEDGPNFRSHLPISMDGSCNGYQHLSAMGRDPIGGRATNLFPFENPQDIYQEVADAVIRRLQRDAANARSEDAEAARELLAFAIDREVVKHATMTTPYGVTRGTIYKQLVESQPVSECSDPKKCARYLAKVLEECIPEVAVEAGKIMEWLRNIARILAKMNRGITWTTPTGFRVVHACRKPKTARIKTKDGTFVIYLEDETSKIDIRKQVDGIVAHLVHSFDAAHMMLTTNRLKAEGIHHFSMVHDSFGVHAADVDLLHRILREEFVRIYSEPVLQNFLNEQRAAHPGVDLPEPPQTGNLDIRQVLSSLYFFA
ncbi:MAG TPA: DNA-directed RNA polymerase [Terriglobia bacterium]|jgi:DNA-directed RNA polymerase